MHTVFKQILSYIWPITQKTYSDVNGTLEVTWFNGKKMLNTQNANYSYGSLQKILSFGLTKVSLSNVSNVLVLGLAGGSVIKTLRNQFRYKGHITAVDIDPVVIKIAKEEFDIYQYDPLQISCADAFDFVKKKNQSFQIVIVDIFVDQYVLSTCYEKEFWNDLNKLIPLEGKIIFNAGIHSTDIAKVRRLKNDLSHLFSFEQYDQVIGTNTIIVAKSIRKIEC